MMYMQAFLECAFMPTAILTDIVVTFSDFISNNSPVRPTKIRYTAFPVKIILLLLKEVPQFTRSPGIFGSTTSTALTVCSYWFSTIWARVLMFRLPFSQVLGSRMSSLGSMVPLPYMYLRHLTFAASERLPVNQLATIQTRMSVFLFILPLAFGSRHIRIISEKDREVKP